MMLSYSQNLTDRERLLLLVGGGVVTIFVLYLLVYLPLSQAFDSSQRALQSEKARYHHITRSIADLNLQDKDQIKNQKPKNTSVRSAITESAQDLNISISRLQPGNDGQISVWFNDISGSDFFNWLSKLESEQGLTVKKFSLTPNRDQQNLRAQVSFQEEQ